MKKTEAKIQQECVMWFQRTYPEYAGLFISVPNEFPLDVNAIASVLSDDNSKVIQIVRMHLNKALKRLKDIGMKKGASDTILLVPNKRSNNCYVEFKTPEGKQRPDQASFEIQANKFGEYYICRSLEEFKKIIKKYLQS